MAPTTPPLRLLVVLPKWVGDCTMATPSLRLIRRAFPGIFIGALARPGLEPVFAGSDFFDEIHVERGSGVMGYKHVAAKLRPRRYDTAILLPNSFSTALITRLAGIPRRIGFDRDARGLLLTHRIAPLPGPGGRHGIVSYVDYVYTLVRRLLLPLSNNAPALGFDAALPPHDAGYLKLPPAHYMELATTAQEEEQARSILERAGLRDAEPLALLTPGGNNIHKRWPAERFAALAQRLVDAHGFKVAITGAPNELDLVERVARDSGRDCILLPKLGLSLGALKPVLKRSTLSIANDTGPRHMAAALAVPLLTFFGPNDYRWATVPTYPGAPELMLWPKTNLPESEIANDHPELSRIDRIPLEEGLAALDRLVALVREKPTVVTRGAAATVSNDSRPG